MSKWGPIFASILFFVLFMISIDLGANREKSPQHMAASLASPFIYSFNAPGVLNEAERMEDSSSPYWWLNSGGQFIIEDDKGTGGTMQGIAPIWNRWRLLYAFTNPQDTDNGVHPQNLFRLVSKSTWENPKIEISFKINRDNWSTSPNRNASNGILLMSRYEDSSTLYYAGLRVDGLAIIKKKYHGQYYTMAQKKEYAGTYTSEEHISMLPHQTWIGLRSETVTNADGSVTLTLYTRTERGIWRKVLEARDSGQYGGTSPITDAGFIGIRTDFMDVSFENIRVENI